VVVLEPNDVDVFMLMENDFDLNLLGGEAAMLFDHASAQRRSAVGDDTLLG
jgi:hypothetical protein